MDTNRITDLTLKYIRKQLSLAEQEELDVWLELPGNRARFEQRIREEAMLESVFILQDAAALKQEARKQIAWNEEAGPVVKPIKRRWFKPLAAAAVALGLVILGVDLWQDRAKTTKPVDHSSVAQDLPPGGAHATLTLSNGTVVTLDTVRKGLLTVQGGLQVSKTGDDVLTYQKGVQGGEIAYNTLATPRGGTFQITLPDGTKVWLNAQSSLRYPTSFMGASREVEMTGEAFFDVAKDKAKPFRVTTPGATVIALGTQFNVMAYADEEALQATLVDGSVKVLKENDNAMLVPGQQAEITDKISVRHVNVDQVTAWRNGLFEFNGADIETVMRSISRWYDVDVRYAAGKDKHTFTGQIQRSDRASEALQILATSGYHFKIEAKTITVLP